MLCDVYRKKKYKFEKYVQFFITLVITYCLMLLLKTINFFILHSWHIKFYVIYYIIKID